MKLIVEWLLIYHLPDVLIARLGGVLHAFEFVLLEVIVELWVHLSIFEVALCTGLLGCLDLLFCDR